MHPAVVSVRFSSSAAAYRLASELRRRFDATPGLEVRRSPDGRATVQVPARIWSLQGVPELIRGFGGSENGRTPD
ncbi:MAG TPA: hypothetical protein VNF73_08465 [Candidatus Saccharimonadales bacterium]|nr:hypothetical protein [Candidatus Saccharimonadales bacterium]